MYMLGLIFSCTCPFFTNIPKNGPFNTPLTDRGTNFLNKLKQVEGDSPSPTGECTPLLSTAFYNGNTCKRLSENPEFAEMRHGDVILHYNDVTSRRAVSVRPTFIFPTDWFGYVR